MPIDLTVVGLRWLQFAAAVLALGLPLFRLYVPTASAGSAWIPTAIWAGLLLAFAAAGGLLAQTAMMAGAWRLAMDLTSVGYVVQSTSLGMAHVGRVGLALLGAVLLLTGRGRRAWTAMAALAFAGAVASFAWSGHGASSQGAAGWVHLVADIIHAWAAAVWLGALAGFLIMLAARDRGDVEASARSLAGFGTVGTGAVLALTLSGIVNAAFLVGAEGVDRVPGSTWGQLLIAKLALFAVMIWLATRNRYTLTPALQRALKAREDTREAVRGLRRSVGLEMVAGVALLGLVAAMGVQMPPASM